jgi:membrane protein YqaA with SNARE-associated domain
LSDVGAGAGPAREPALSGTRAWFVFFVLWMAAWAGLALWALNRSALGDEGLALRVWLFALLCFYLSLCNTFIPLPTAWAVLLAAAPDYALVETGWLRVLLTAGLLGLVTAVANLNEYHLLAYLLRFGLGRRVRRSSLYAWAVRWFDRSPLLILTVIAFVPIPVDVVRWLAIVRHYSRTRYAFAYFVGRGVRYLLLAVCSLVFVLGAREIALIQAVLILMAILTRVAWYVVRRRRPTAPPATGVMPAAK